MYSDTFTEEALGLFDLWKPLQTSYTISSTTDGDTGGAPEGEEGDLSPEGERSREQRIQSE